MSGPSTFSFSVDSAILRAALAFTCKEHPVTIFADGRIAATDKHTMVVFYPDKMLGRSMRTGDVKFELNLSSCGLDRFMVNSTLQGDVEFLCQPYAHGLPKVTASYTATMGRAPAQVLSSDVPVDLSTDGRGVMSKAVDECLAACQPIASLGAFCIDPAYVRRLEPVSFALHKWKAWPWLMSCGPKSASRWDFHTEAGNRLATVLIMPVASTTPGS
jgi:hypothetical protein